MSQQRSGLAAVVSNSPYVQSVGVVWDTIVAGSLFRAEGDWYWYEVLVVEAISADTYRLTLNSPYIGTTRNTSYTLSTSFTPNYNIPYPETGDTGTMSILRRALLRIDAILATGDSLIANTLRSVAVVNDAATGNAYGIEHVSAVQDGSYSSLRLFAAGDGNIVFGKYTNASTFQRYGWFDTSGVLNLSSRTFKAGANTFSLPEQNGTVALVSDIGSANSLVTGTVSPARLPDSGVTAGAYGTPTQLPRITVDRYGRVTAVTMTDISYAAVTGQNLGSAIGVYSGKSGNALQFKSLRAGSNIQLIESANEILISSVTVGGGSDADMYRSAYDTDLDGKVDFAETADNVNWEGVLGRPNIIQSYGTASHIDISSGTSVDSYGVDTINMLLGDPVAFFGARIPGGLGGNLVLKGGDASRGSPGSNAGSADLSAGDSVDNYQGGTGGSLLLNGESASTYASGGSGGTIDMRGTSASTVPGKDGGSIIMKPGVNGVSPGGNAGSIFAQGGLGGTLRGGNGGILRMQGGDGGAFAGGDSGSIDLSGEAASAATGKSGGSLITRNGGGSIDTEQGYLELGTSSSRVVLRKASTVAGVKEVEFPNENGTVATREWVNSNYVSGTSSESNAVSTIAALKALSVSGMLTGTRYKVDGYYSAGDGGGGVFTYQSSSSLADNLGTVIAPNSGLGRWIRDWQSVVSIRAFGAKTDLTNQQVSLQNCLTASAGLFDIEIPEGEYRHSAVLNVSSPNLRILGKGRLSAFSANTQTARLRIAASNVYVEGITLDGRFTNYALTNENIALLEIDGESSALSSISLNRVSFANTRGYGVYFHGGISELRVACCRFEKFFNAIFGESSTNGTFSKVDICDNQIHNAWTTVTYTGGIKLKGQLGDRPYAIDCFDNTISNAGEMGIEYWKRIRDSQITSNKVKNCGTCISVDECLGVQILGNGARQYLDVGIEIATACQSILVSDNQIDNLNDSDVRNNYGTGIIVSNETCSYIVIHDNVVRGTYFGIKTFGANLINIRDNHVYDCDVLLYTQNTNNVQMAQNHLYGPCGYHVFVDASGASVSDLDITSNHFYGHASSDCLIIYRGGSSNTVSNLRIHGNNTIAATRGNLSINLHVPLSSMPNAQCYDNYYKEASGSAVFADFSSSDIAPLPYSSALQKGGYSNAGKLNLVLPVSAVDRWYKVFSLEYGHSVFLNLSIRGDHIDNAPTAAQYQIFSAPYNRGANIIRYPTPPYNSPVIKELAVRIDASAVHEVWVQIRANAQAGSLDFYFSDYPAGIVTSPTPQTATPTFPTGSYRCAIQQDQSEFQISRLYVRDSIACAPNGALVSQGARVHVRGSHSSGNLFRIDKEDTGSVYTLTNSGDHVYNGTMRLGTGGTRLAQVASRAENFDFGTINADTETGYDLYVECSSGNTRTPTVSIGWGAQLPIGVVVKQVWILGLNTIQVVLKNTTSAAIVLGTRKIRMTVWEPADAES